MVVVTLTALATAACAAPSISSRDGFDGQDGKPGSDTGSFGDQDSSGDSAGTVGDPKALGDDQQACASSFTEGTVRPVNLVFMYDKSQSMTQPTGSGASKWDAAKSGVGNFIADPGSAGLSATIQFFSGPPVGQGGVLCQAATYSTAAAGPVALPDSGGLISGAIAHQSPSGGTATYYALQGARQIANTVLAQKPGEKAAIIFVTDGEPDGCSFDNSIDNTAAFAAQCYAAGIPTYVIGVGNSLSSLNAIAKSGGSTKAYIVDANGTNVANSLLSALTEIRGHVASCSIAIPDAPAGKTLDYNAVNVGYGGDTLTYSKDCSSGEGWHYDDATNPHSIDLCTATCTDVKNTANAKVTIALGCATKGGVVR